MENENENVNVVDTSTTKGDGQNKCPKCGATDISLSTKTGKLRCNFCRHEFEPEKFDGMETDISKLKGKTVGSGAKNIVNDDKSIMTLKCTSCGAEVVIDTNEATRARCHWCRNALSINQQVPNGAVPDVVLPFKTSKKEAQEKINKFVGNRMFFAHPKFKQEFTTDNIMGVYLPYMVVDINAHDNMTGEGEIETRKYTVSVGDDEETRYDADLYSVERDFDITIEGLTVESSMDKLDTKSKKTNNIINSIMPFDIENAVKWDANYIAGYTSEKRDTNVEQLDDIVKTQAQDIARYKINDAIKEYDRGVHWKNEKIDVKGEQWKAAYLPVWLYSYYEKRGSSFLLHYVAVNARTNETMGSVPLNKPLLFAMSALVEIICLTIGFVLCGIFYDGDLDWPFWVSLFGGLIFYGVKYAKYRNTSAIHHHESETKAIISNVVKNDAFIKARKGLRNSSIEGQNNHKVSKRADVKKMEK